MSSNSSSSSDSSLKRKHEEEIDVTQVAASVAARQSEKRYKFMPKTDFRCTVSPSNNLATMVYTLEAILTEVNLHFCKSASFSGIRVDTTSPDLTCMVKAKLACNVNLSEGSKLAVAVNIKEMKPIMKAAQGETAIDIARYSGNDHLSLECVTHIPLRTFTLPTIVMEEDEERLFDITTQFTIQMSCASLKDFARNSGNFHVETIRLHVSTFEEDNGTLHTFFALSCHDGTLERARVEYHSEGKVDEQADGPIEIVCDSQITPDEIFIIAKSKDIRREYEAEFASIYITDFLKSFDRGDVFLSLAQGDDGPGPMILHVSLGSDNSYMRLVLAPKISADE